MKSDKIQNNRRDADESNKIQNSQKKHQYENDEFINHVHKIKQQGEDSGRDITQEEFDQYPRTLIKYATDPLDVEKLNYQIRFLDKLFPTWKPYFSKIKFSRSGPDPIYWMVNYYPYYQSLEDLIFSGEIQSLDAIETIEQVLDFEVGVMYYNTLVKYKIDAMKSMKQKFMKRKEILQSNLINLIQKSTALGTKHACRFLNKLIKSESFVWNENKLENFEVCMKRLEKDSILVKELVSNYGGVIHQDLHLANILKLVIRIPDTRQTPFKLIDPGGNPQPYDIAYDIGKMLHSLRGYTFIHRGKFELHYFEENNTIGANGKIITSPETAHEPNKKGGSLAQILEAKTVVDPLTPFVLDAIELEFPKIIDKYGIIKNDPNWEIRSKFYEATNFLTMPIFHLKEDVSVDRPIMLYIRGIELLNEFVSRCENTI